VKLVTDKVRGANLSSKRPVCKNVVLAERRAAGLIVRSEHLVRTVDEKTRKALVVVAVRV
jgi:hypothetical protein